MEEMLRGVLEWFLFASTTPAWVGEIVAIGASLLLWFNPAWATMMHELGHAIVSSALGMKVSSISLNADSSGLTKSSYKVRSGIRGGLGAPFRWVRKILVKMAGYPAPFVFSLLTSASAYYGVGRAFLLLCFIACLYTLLKADNLFGRGVSFASACITFLLLFSQDSGMLGASLAFLYGVGIGGGARGLHSLWHATIRGDKGHSDAYDLSKITLIPASLWVGVFFVGAILITGLSISIWM